MRADREAVMAPFAHNWRRQIGRRYPGAPDRRRKFRRDNRRAEYPFCTPRLSTKFSCCSRNGTEPAAHPIIFFIVPANTVRS
jgi:hypothetical protein